MQWIVSSEFRYVHYELIYYDISVEAYLWAEMKSPVGKLVYRSQ